MKSVYGLWGHLPDRAFRLLAFMALTSKDEDDPPRYWGGREVSAVGLGRKVPAGSDPTEVRARRAAFEAVQSALTQLVRAGAIQRTRSAVPGRPAEYILILRTRSVQAEPVSNGSRDRGDSVQGYPAPIGTGPACVSVQADPGDRYRPSLSTAQDQPVPEEQEEDPGLNDDQPLTVPSLPTDHARSARLDDQHEFEDDGSGRDECVCSLPRRSPKHRRAA